ncbi:MAG TPA: hypothetical protein VJX68_11495 [Candidatus Binatus sp.]|nr:hypothetical protein [Candidatus Binatus sp.]
MATAQSPPVTSQNLINYEFIGRLEFLAIACLHVDAGLQAILEPFGSPSFTAPVKRYFAGFGYLLNVTKLFRVISRDNKDGVGFNWLA